MLITSTQAADLLDVERQVVVNYIKRGLLTDHHAHRNGGGTHHVALDPKEVREFKTAHTFTLTKNGRRRYRTSPVVEPLPPEPTKPSTVTKVKIQTLTHRPDGLPAPGADRYMDPLITELEERLVRTGVASTLPASAPVALPTKLSARLDAIEAKVDRLLAIWS
jgi:hypothetical protein